MMHAASETASEFEFSRKAPSMLSVDSNGMKGAPKFHAPKETFVSVKVAAIQACPTY